MIRCVYRPASTITSRSSFRFSQDEYSTVSTVYTASIAVNFHDTSPAAITKAMAVNNTDSGGPKESGKAPLADG